MTKGREIHFDTGHVGHEAHKTVHFDAGIAVDREKLLGEPALREFMKTTFAELGVRQTLRAEAEQVHEVRQRARSGLAAVGDVFSLCPKGPK